MKTIISLIKDNHLGKMKLNESLVNHSYVKTGGKVSVLYFPKNEEALIKVIKECEKKNILFKVIGRGSNIIFPDKDLEIVIIKINGSFEGVDFIDDTTARIGSGASLQKISRMTSKMGLSGLEFAGGIPATVGGATYMNAGAHTQEIGDIVEEVLYLDQDYKIKTIKKADCAFSYRSSIFHDNNWIILSVLFKFRKSTKKDTFKRMSGNLAYRQEMQPLDKPSFGSVFRNPEKHHAGKLIEDLGLKGLIIGDAMISEKHANFIINLGDAKSEDLKKLIRYVQKEVMEKKDIYLTPEVEFFLDGIDD